MRIVFYILFLFLLFLSDIHKKEETCPVTQLIADTTLILAENDDPDLAAEFEFERTKDPALGYVPKGRLVDAYNYTMSMKIDNEAKEALGPLYDITWVERGPDNCGGRTRAIMVDPNDATKKTLWAGGVDGGLWKTTDITVSNPVWTNINDFFANLAVTTIAYDPSNTQIMYFGTGEGWYNMDAVRGDGIFKSTDGGATWFQLASTQNNSNFDYVSKIVVDATGNVFCANRSRYCNRGGIFKSTNGGTSWTLVLGTQGNSCNNSNCSGDDIEIAADGDLYAGMGDFYKSDGVYRSSNSGSSWTKVGTFANSGRIELACAPSVAATVFAMAEDRITGGLLNIYRTSNDGTTWTTLAKPFWHDQLCGAASTDFTRGQAWYDLAIAVDPANANNVLVGGVDIFKSTNGGTSWTQITNWAGLCSFPMVHADQHIMIFEPGSSSVMYFGNDGGVWRTTNANASLPTITSKNSSYNVTQFYSVAIHPTATDYFICGAQDNGSHKFTSSGMNSTVQVRGGDGAFCHIDQNDSKYQYTAYTYCRFGYTRNGGSTWSDVYFGSGGQFINPSDYDNNSFVLYAAYSPGYYMRWINPRTGLSGQSIYLGGLTTGKVTAVKVSQNTANRVFFGINDGKILRLDNANASPSATNITGAGMPVNATVSCIEVEDGDDDHLVVTYSNYGVNSVWETFNGGTSWTSIEGDLPDMPVRWAVFNPYDSNQVLLATELGVWASAVNKTSSSWIPINTGLANVRVDMLKVRQSDKLIAAATHGRGLFTSNISQPLPIELLSFKAVCSNNAVHLSWVTASETNNDYFTVEKSKNGIDFLPIGIIDGAGNSYVNKYYSYIDAKINTGITFYRLKQTDFDGTYTYSNVVTVICEDVYDFDFIHANYNNNQLVISFTSDEGQCEYYLYDMVGKQLHYEITNTAGGINEISSKAFLNKGIYLIVLKNKEKVISKKIMVP